MKKQALDAITAFFAAALFAASASSAQDLKALDKDKVRAVASEEQAASPDAAAASNAEEPSARKNKNAEARKKKETPDQGDAQRTSDEKKAEGKDTAENAAQTAPAENGKEPKAQTQPERKPYKVQYVRHKAHRHRKDAHE